MADTEKITVNLSVVDLGQIDLLVDQGLYSNRTDLIRTAIRNQIDRHEVVVQQTIDRQALAVGVLVFSRADLERHRAGRERVDINVVGMVIIDRDVPPELARETINSVHVLGVFRAAAAVKEALSDRIVQLL